MFENGNRAEYQYVTDFNVASNVGVNTNPSRYYLANVQEIYSGVGLTGTMVPMAFGQTAAEAALAPTTTSATTEVLIRRAEYTMEFTNMAPQPCFLTIYVLKSAKDTGSDVAGTPSVIWESAVDDESGTAGAANVSSLWPFGRPTPNKSFRDRWTTVHTFDCTLSVGEVRRHTMHIGINKHRNYGDLLQNQGFLKGITHYCLVVARGPPTDTNNSALAGTIMFAPTKVVGVIGTKQYVTVTEKQSKVLNQYNGLPTVGVAALYSVNDDSGAAVNVNQVAGYG